MLAYFLGNQGGKDAMLLPESAKASVQLLIPDFQR
jgi:hypothetical protein